MGFANFVKKFAIVLFILAAIGAFPLAKKISTTVTVTESLYGNSYTDEDTNKVEYIAVLLVSWTSAGIVCIFLYGLGKIIEYLDSLDDKILAPHDAEKRLYDVIKETIKAKDDKN